MRRAAKQEEERREIIRKALTMAIYSGSLLAFAAAVAAFTGSLAGGEHAATGPDWYALGSFVGLVTAGIFAAFFALLVARASNWNNGPSIDVVGDTLDGYTPEDVIAGQIAAYGDAETENQKIVDERERLFGYMLWAIGFETVFLAAFITFTFII